jgi:hypothetical protein
MASAMASAMETITCLENFFSVVVHVGHLRMSYHWLCMKKALSAQLLCRAGSVCFPSTPTTQNERWYGTLSQH